MFPWEASTSLSQQGGRVTMSEKPNINVENSPLFFDVGHLTNVD